MPSPIQDMAFIQRLPATKEIDVQGSLHAFAKELISQRDTEKRIRHNRRYRNAIQAVLKANNNNPLSRAQLVRSAIARLRVKEADRSKTLDELWVHITYNRQHGYLLLAANGVALKEP